MPLVPINPLRSLPRVPRSLRVGHNTSLFRFSIIVNAVKFLLARFARPVLRDPTKCSRVPFFRTNNQRHQRNAAETGEGS